MLTYVEKRQDLFTVDTSYSLAHCIAEDALMGAGIAVEFVNRFPEMTRKLRQMPLSTGNVVMYTPPGYDSHILNLITKERSNGKPTYESYQTAVRTLVDTVQRYSIKKIAMPKMGAGLDRLDWQECRKIILNEFENVDIEILVCYL